MSKGPRALLPQLAQLQRQGLASISGLLEGQTRSRNFADQVARLTATEHQRMIDHLQEGARQAEEPAVALAMEVVAERCRNLDRTLALLVDERQREWERNGAEVRQLMHELNDTVAELNSTLIDKDLLERQSEVLEQIILSHERVTQWEDFVAGILESFLGIFPFRFFFIAFAEENALALNLFYGASCSEEVARYARQHFATEMLDALELPRDAAVDIQERTLNVDGGGPAASTDEVDMLTVAVPEHLPRLAGVLGVAFGTDQQLTPQEASTIRSILSVMVMVVGSSKALSRTLEDLEYYSMSDPLTGLYNRRHFHDLLETEQARAQRHGHTFALLLVDVDDFKDINDSFGHSSGDETLRRLGHVVREHTRRGDTIARLGSDELAILMPETSKEAALDIADSIRQEAREIPFSGMGEERFHLTVSVGVVTYPGDGESVHRLLACGDDAVQGAKERGKNEVSTAGASERGYAEVRTQRLHAESMREALREGRIQPYFHSIVDCRSGEIFGYEALARLHDESGETLPAGRFMGAIERYGLSRDLDRVMLESALGEQAGDDRATRLFLNLSPAEIQNRGLLGRAEALCEDLGVSPERVVFELLEREAIEDLPSMRHFLSELRKKGFAFALDDFGSGYNSFHYLRELELDFVKIDGAFVRNTPHSKVDYALVANLAQLCSDLGIATIAEFIDSEEVLEAVRSMGVDYAQGFHLSLPRPNMAPPGEGGGPC